MKFDGNFKRMNESLMQDRYIGKNLAELRRSIDSMTVRIDSIKQFHSQQLYTQSYRRLLNEPEKLPAQLQPSEDAVVAPPNLNFDQIYLEKKPSEQLAFLSQVQSSIEGIQNDYRFKANSLVLEEREMRRHHTEMHQKFAFSFACLVFFFIGAPLGAIIRKGGLGLPAVISVVLFIFYHIISNIGFKMASNGMWQPWVGMWISSAILLPLGIFLTYKAANDSPIMNSDTYVEALKKLNKLREFINKMLSIHI
jgi:lipopolysaccharide export system permease protein